MYVIKRRSIKPRRIRIDSNTLEAIRHPDLFDSLFKTQRSWVASIVRLKGRVRRWIKPSKPTKFERMISKDG